MTAVTAIAKKLREKRKQDEDTLEKKLSGEGGLAKGKQERRRNGHSRTSGTFKVYNWMNECFCGLLRIFFFKNDLFSEIIWRKLLKIIKFSCLTEIATEVVPAKIISN